MLDVGSGDVALEEPAGASVAQADWFTVTDAAASVETAAGRGRRK